MEAKPGSIRACRIHKPSHAFGFIQRTRILSMPLSSGIRTDPTLHVECFDRATVAPHGNASCSVTIAAEPSPSISIHAIQTCCMHLPGTRTARHGCYRAAVRGVGCSNRRTVESPGLRSRGTQVYQRELL